MSFINVGILDDQQEHWEIYQSYRQYFMPHLHRREIVQSMYCRHWLLSTALY